MNSPTGCEISPDSKLLYVSTHGYPDGGIDNQSLLQYDLTILDSLSFLNSCVIIDTAARPAGLQLAPDGKIYAIRYLYPQNDTLFYYLDVIHDPWKRGTACNFEPYAVNLQLRKAYSNLPNFPQDWLYRFVWSGGPCAGVPFQFRHRFIPEPDSIHWDFGDPGSGPANTSNDHNPVHTFSQGGEFEVYAYIRYPNGRIEETSRKVEVLPKPYPNLGPDTLVCMGTSLTLTPGSGFAGYYWNGNITPGPSSITVSDTGTYFVRVKNDLGCFNADTIRVLPRPLPQVDETNLSIAPATCGGSTGSITGLAVNGQPPLTWQWTASGTPAGNTPDLYHLTAGLYELWITDGYGCTGKVASYALSDAGNILIDTVEFSPSYCADGNGSINITAISGLGSRLQYFIRSGSDTLSQWSNGDFSNLLSGNYYIWVKDSSGCTAVYSHPVSIATWHSPQVVSVITTPETEGESDGSITIVTMGSNLAFRLNGGSAVGSGIFSGLTAGDYTVNIATPYGCDTTFTVTVGLISGLRLQAIVGNGRACKGATATASLLVSNFRDVQWFDATLKYNGQQVQCEGYTTPNAMLADSLKVTLYGAQSKIRVQWTGVSPVTLPDSSRLLQLVFSALSPGVSLVEWDISPNISHFIGTSGDTLRVDYHIGNIAVSSPPRIMNAPDAEECEGSVLMLWPSVTDGAGPLSYLWQTPGGMYDQLMIIRIAETKDGGIYRFRVSDTLGCADSAQINVWITPTPKATFHGQDTLYLEPGSTLDAGNGFGSYRWNTGDSTQRIITGSEGWYSVTLKAGKCTATDSVYITTPYAPLYLPTAFTPNGDGLNDVFRPVTNPDQISNYSLQVFDKWGGLIFESRNPQVGWDGHFGASAGSATSALAPVGVYTYVVRYGSRSAAFSKKERVIRGMVTVVR